MEVITTLTRREEIAKEAAHLFRIKGYGSSSMRDIAASIGIEASSLYNHFQGKGHILLSICLQVADWYESELADLNSKPISPLEKLTSLIEFLLELYQKERDMVESANQEWKHLPDSEKQKYYLRRKQFESEVITIIEMGQISGHIDTIPARIIMLAILQTPRILDNYQKQPDADTKDAKQLRQYLTQLILHGLVKPRLNPNV